MKIQLKTPCLFVLQIITLLKSEIITILSIIYRAKFDMIVKQLTYSELNRSLYALSGQVTNIAINL